MRKNLTSLFLLLLLITNVIAQERTITGTVTDKTDGGPLPGVSIKIKGGTTGTQTNANGKYTIRIPGDNAVLVFSFIGYATQETNTGSRSVVDVVLGTDTKVLGEVVVTALGVSRERKSIGYATTTVNNEELTRSSSVAPLQGLMGKVAGAQISTTSGSPGGSTKIVLRGYSSITGSSQPLFIVDGVPINNSRPGSLASGVGNLGNNYDFGNAANDINPDDIESVNILKGASATNLYGSRGSNGVIVITTKKGKAGKFSVDISSAATFTQVSLTPTYQNEFGQGWDGQFILSENGSWGPALDGATRPWGAIYNNTQLIKPFSFQKDNYRGAFNTGQEYNNNLTIRGGNETSTYKFSYGNIASDGILPTNNDSYKRNTFGLDASTKYKGLKINTSFNYVAKNAKFVEVGQATSGIAANFYEEILQIPTDIPIADLQDYKNTYFNVDNYFTPFAENPYYPLYENGSKLRANRQFGNIDLNYEVNKFRFQFQQGFDVNHADVALHHAKNAPSPGSWNDGANPESAQRQADVGNVVEGYEKYYEYDSKLQAFYASSLSESFNFDAFAGLNYNDRGSEALYTGVEDLTIPGVYNLANAVNKPVSNSYKDHRRLIGAYASATFDYNKYLFLTLNARNDWSSTLPKGKNSFFYPGANLAFTVSDAFDLSLPSLDYWKLRLSVGQTGKDASPYYVANTIRSTVVNVRGSGTVINFPVNNVAGYTISNTLNNSNLKPELTTEVEVGTEARFFKNRLGIDFAFYNKISDKQILPVDISPASGYLAKIVNFGKVRNRGIEIALNANPVRTNKFGWDFTYTFARNRNMVLSLPEGLSQIEIESAYDAQFLAIENKPLGVYKAPVPKRDPEGRIIINPSNGLAVPAADSEIYGNMQQKFIMGLNNSFTFFKNFRLGFVLDYRLGGKFYSGTADLLNFVGNDVKTTYNDRKPFIIPNSVIEITDANGNVTGYEENTIPVSEVNMDDYYYHSSNKAMAYYNRILDKSFLKLREITLGYSLPKTFLSRLNASNATFTLIGRNLFLWLPSDNRSIDPELSNYGTGLASEFGEFRTAPSTRNFGASLKVTF